MMFRFTSLLLIMLCFSFDIKGQGNGAQLFTFTDELQSEWPAKTNAQIERAPMEFDNSVLKRIKDGSIENFQMYTLDEELLEVEVRRVINHYNGDWSVTGRINGDWKNSFTLSYSDGQVLSSINNITSHRFFEIVYSSQEQFHSFTKVDPHKKDNLTCGIDHSHNVSTTTGSNKIQNDQLPEIDEAEHVTIDVMIVYTPRARSWANLNMGNIQNVINQSMAIAQNAVDNSGINLEFRLVHSALVGYSESSSSDTDLRRLTTSPTFTALGSQYIGYLDEVHEWREVHKADLVAMFTDVTDVGGLAWILRNENGDSRFGFSITRVQQAASLTHAHEMGHNMGNAHSRNQQSNAAGPDGGLFNYSTGWRWIGNTGTGLTSVMTYAEGDANVDIFSNPDILVQGVPSGSYTEPFAPADNARSMREIKSTISLYKEAVGIPVVQIDSVYSITAGKAEVGVTVSDPGTTSIRSQGVCWSTSPNPSISDLCTQSFLNSTSTFSITLTGLNGNTNYYVRSYATNNGGTAYSNNAEFRTKNISGNNSIVTASRNRVLATGQQESEIEVTVLNASFEPVEDVYVELEQEGGNSDITVINNVTDENGIASFVVSNISESSITYSAVADDLTINRRVEIEYLYSNPETTLGNNFPNPFNNQTVIPIVIPEQSRVRIDIFNISGSRIQTIFDQQMDVGYYEIPFNADQLASGVYFYRLTTNQEMKFEKMLLLK